MRATTIHGTRDIRVSEVPDPTIDRADRRDRQGRRRLHLRLGPVALPRRERRSRRATRSATSASASSRRSAPTCASFRPGDFVIVPFDHCDNTCPHCLAGAQSGCVNLGFTESGQAEYTLVTQAEGSLVKTDGMPDAGADPVAADALRRDADRLARRGRPPASARAVRRSWSATARSGCAACWPPSHAGRRDGRRDVAPRAAPGDRPRRSAPPHIVAERGKEGVEAVMELTGGSRRRRRARVRRHRPVDADRVRDRPPRLDGRLRRRPARRRAAGAPDVPARTSASPAAWRRSARYLPELLDLVLAGAIDPGLVFDLHAAARRGRRGLPRDGRAARDQGADRALSAAATSVPLAGGVQAGADQQQTPATSSVTKTRSSLSRKTPNSTSRMPHEPEHAEERLLGQRGAQRHRAEDHDRAR